MKCNLIFVVAAALAACLVGSLEADMVTTEFTTIDDGRVQFSGVNGKTLHTSEEDVLTLRSGNSNVSDGLFDFDLSAIPDDAVIVSAEILFRTAAVIGNTGSTAPVDFFGFAGNGVIELSDEQTGAALIAAVEFPTGLANDTDVAVELSNLEPLENLLTDGNSDDFFTLRTETVNFVSLQVDSLESTASDAAPARLRVTYETSSVPEPSSLVFLSLGAIGCLVRRRA